MEKKDGLLRWHSADQFENSWSERNSAMFELCEYLDTKTMSCIEYGCGPNRPFSSLFSQRFLSFTTSDTKSWCDTDVIVNLNDTTVTLPEVGVSVLSGVLEYLSNPESSLKNIANSSEYILLSYVYVDPPIFTKLSQRTKFIRLLRERAVGVGYRNHFSQSQFLSLISQVGYIENIKTWKNQIIVLIKTS